MHFKRLKVLFTMVFSEEYRQDLVTDGTSELIREGTLLTASQYTSRAAHLTKSTNNYLKLRGLSQTRLIACVGEYPEPGTGQSWMISRCIVHSWYAVIVLLGSLGRFICHQAIYLLAFPWILSPSSLTSIVLLQQAVFALRFSVAELLHESQRSFEKVFLLAKEFYDAIVVDSSMRQGAAGYPISLRSSDRGMKVSFT